MNEEERQEVLENAVRRVFPRKDLLAVNGEAFAHVIEQMAEVLVKDSFNDERYKRENVYFMVEELERQKKEKQRIVKSLKHIGTCLDRLDISMHSGEPECQDSDWDHILSECRKTLQSVMDRLAKEYGIEF